MSPAIPLVPDPPAPPDGDPEQAESHAVDLLACAATIGEAVESADDGATGDWTGSAAEGYAASMGRLAADLEPMALALRFSAAACREWADQRVAARRRHADLLGRHRWLSELRAGLQRDAAAGDPLTVGQVESRADQLRQEIAVWVGTCETLRADCTRADDVLVTEIRFAGEPHQLATRMPELVVAPGHTLPPLILLLPTLRGQRPRWWRSLDQSERERIIAAWPEVVGGLGGLPAGARDLANRILLRRDLLRLRALDDPSQRQRRRLHELEDLDEALSAADDHRDPRTGDTVPIQLWLYDPDAHGGDGTIALSVGDADTAEDVVVQVPGFGNDLSTLATPEPFGNSTLMDRMFDLHDTARGESSRSNSTLIWIGYDAPDNLPAILDPGLDGLSVVTDGLARDGAGDLRDDLRDLLGARDDDPHVTLIGHSYGSAVVGLASAGGGIAGIDDVVLLGSAGPGRGVDEATDLGDPGHVWIGRDSLDPVTHIGDHATLTGVLAPGTGLGVNPATDGFGGVRFHAENPGAGPDLLQHHMGYFDPGTESLHNITQIIVGEHDDVAIAEHVHDPLLGPAWDPEAEWVVHEAAQEVSQWLQERASRLAG